MVFAAGLGSRLKPFTLEHPKALVEVGGIPMLRRVLLNIKDAGVSRVVVNVHHFADQIIDFLAQNNNFGLNLDISREDTLLDTGGGLLKARTLLDDGSGEPILLHNADVLTNFPLTRLQLRGDATLLVSSRPSSRQLIFNEPEMRLCGWINLKENRLIGSGNGTPRAFNGIHLVSPAIFPSLEQYSREIGSPIFSLTPFYITTACTLQIHGQEAGRSCWFDVGRPESLEIARQWADSLC